MDTSFENNTRAGIHRGVDLSILNDDEKSIIKKLSANNWYVTRIQPIALGGSTYHVALIKPTSAVSVIFNLYREIPVIFSNYDVFEPRAFDVLDALEIQELRLEEICSIVISRDENVTNVISDILKSNQESRVLVPFTYKELLGCDNFDNFFINKMRTNFFSRDLFDIQDALKEELFFFGRRELIQELANKHDRGENSGIFGLRKTGKTSILYGIGRTLKKKKSLSVFIDCQTLHNKPWNLALQHVVLQIVEQCQLKKKLLNPDNSRYSNEYYAADSFFEDMQLLLKNDDKRNILLIFDEIENISFDTSITETWKNGYSFIKFWQSVRSAYQRNQLKYKFTYLIAGTNPRCVEVSTIDSVDNPLFQQFSPIYIEPFSFEQTKEMLDRLGGYMGIRFTPEVCTHLKEDFGGHPLLMRQLCSYIHKHLPVERPCNVDKQEYLSYKDGFYKEQTGFSQYATMILQVLQTWYPDEHQMLVWLAVGDMESFKECAKETEFVKHLLRYGIVGRNSTPTEYHFKIEAIQGFLVEKNKYIAPVLSQEDKEKEVQERRSKIEKSLRVLLKRQLKSSLGEANAKEEIIRAIYGAGEIGHKSNIAYKDFFDPTKHEIYLKMLLDVIIRNYTIFQNLFGVKKDTFVSKSQLLNLYRRTDAHSAEISDEDFTTFRGIASWFESILSEE